MWQNKKPYYSILQSNLALLVFAFGTMLVDILLVMYVIFSGSMVSTSLSTVFMMMIDIPVILLALFSARPVPALSFHRTTAKNILITIALAFLSYMALGVLIEFLAETFIVTGGTIPENTVVEEIVREPFIVTFLVLCVFAPFTEEILFRGMLQNAYERRFGWLAILFSAMFFALAHADLLLSINAFFLGLVIGYIFLKTRSLWTAIIFHAVYNFFGFTMLPDLLMRLPWVLGLTKTPLTFSNPYFAAYHILIGASCLLVLLALCYALKRTNPRGQALQIRERQNATGTVLFAVIAVCLMAGRLIIYSSLYFGFSFF